MKLKNGWKVNLAQVVLGAVVVIALMLVRETNAGNEPVHLATDWSHHHLVFSAPDGLMRRYQLSSNVRYLQQWVRRNAERRDQGEGWRWRHAPENSDTLQGDWSQDMGSGATVGAGNFPAKFSFSAGSSNCVTPSPSSPLQPDFVAYNTSLDGSATQASIIAYANLYSGTCTGTVPKVYWAYRTGGTISTSISLSRDGSQVAFVEVLDSGSTDLVMLKWAAGGTGTASAPATPTTVSTTNYRTCTAPCMAEIQLNAGCFCCEAGPSLSAPFYDFDIGADVMYLGDNFGELHKFTGVFSGTPAEVVSNGWPVQVSFSGGLYSPVYVQGATPATSYVYVTDNAGFFYHVQQATPTTTTVVTSASLGTEITDGPLVDSTTGKEYVFVWGNNGGGAAQRSQVVQFNAGFAASNAGSAVSVTSNNALESNGLFTGAFDNTYYTSTDGTGHLYVCSTNGGVSSLWRITLSAGALSAPTAGLAVATDASGCSPVTDNNGTADRVFMSVINHAVTGGVINCGGTTGCIMSFTVVAAGTLPSATSAHALSASGTSGIIVDGSSGSTGASQVYFTPLANQVCGTSGTGGCAIQASQSGLN